MVKKFIFRFFRAIWTFSLQKGWNWILNQTTFDESVYNTYVSVRYRFIKVHEELDGVSEQLQKLKKEVQDVGKALTNSEKKE